MAYWKVDHTTLTLNDGTDIVAGSTGNAIAPNYWDDLAKAGDGTVKFHSSSKTVQLNTAAGGGAAQLRKNLATGAVAVEVEFAGRAWPTTSAIRVFEMRNASDTNFAARLNLLTNGKLELLDTTNTQRWLSTGTVPTNSGWRAYMGVQKGTTTTDGRLQLEVYLTGDGKSTTPSETGFNSTSQNVGTTDMAAFRCGFTSGGPGMLAVRNAQKEDALGALGPVSDPPVMSKTLTLVQKADYSASTGSGLTLTAAQQSGPSVGTITIQGLIATFNDSSTRTDPVVIRYTVTNSAGQFVYEDVTFNPPVGHGSQRIVRRDGVWR